VLSSCGVSNNTADFEADTASPQPSTTPEPSANPITLAPTASASVESTIEPTEIKPTDIKPTSIPTPSERPMGYEQSIPFDGIYPIYDPSFVTADEAPFEDDELVLGVSWDGEAKAYPITVLRFREMVNDELAGIPTLVTY